MAIAWTVYTCWKKKRIAAGPQAHGVSKSITNRREDVLYVDVDKTVTPAACGRQEEAIV